MRGMWKGVQNNLLIESRLILNCCKSCKLELHFDFSYFRGLLFLTRYFLFSANDQFYFRNEYIMSLILCYMILLS